MKSSRFAGMHTYIPKGGWIHCTAFLEFSDWRGDGL